MKVTVSFNILMTLAFIGIRIVATPMIPHDTTPLIITHFFPKSLATQVVAVLISLAITIPASMYFIRALWNHLFPQLCGWKEINLAESYALSIFAAAFFSH